MIDFLSPVLHFLFTTLLSTFALSELLAIHIASYGHIHMAAYIYVANCVIKLLSAAI